MQKFFWIKFTKCWRAAIPQAQHQDFYDPALARQWESYLFDRTTIPWVTRMCTIYY